MQSGDPTKHRARLGRVLAIAVAAGLCLGGYLAWVAVTGRGIPCLIYRYTGRPCASCGLTRALASVLRFDFRAAFSNHLLWPIYVLWGGWVAISDAVVYLRDGRVQWLPGHWWVHILVAAVVTGYGIVRNL